jgi:hypothetical protein
MDDTETPASGTSLLIESWNSLCSNQNNVSNRFEIAGKVKAMDVNMSGLNFQAMALNKAGVDQEILLKTIEKTEGTKLNDVSMEARPVEKVQPEKTGRIDLYV